MKFSFTRPYILSKIVEDGPLSITELSKMVGISRGTTIYRYLEELKQRGLITIDKKENETGQPSIIIATEKGKKGALKSKDIEMMRDLATKTNDLIHGRGPSGKGNRKPQLRSSAEQRLWTHRGSNAVIPLSKWDIRAMQTLLKSPLVGGS